MLINLLLNGNDLFKYKRIGRKSVVEYKGDDPALLADIQSGSQLLHSILSQFFPLSAVAGMGDHARWRVDPHFDEASYTIMHNIMHNEHSAQMANYFLALLKEKPVHIISNSELFPQTSDCGVHFDPVLYRELELRTSGNDPPVAPYSGVAKQTNFLEYLPRHV